MCLSWQYLHKYNCQPADNYKTYMLVYNLINNASIKKKNVCSPTANSANAVAMLNTHQELRWNCLHSHIAIQWNKTTVVMQILMARYKILLCFFK